MINEEQAITIASKESGIDKNLLEIIKEQKIGWRIYRASKEECWQILVHENDDQCLKSSHVILISKETGKMLYNDSANDGE